MDEENRLIRMLALVERLWSRRYAVAAGTLAGIALGAVYALLAPEVYVSRAVIYPKEISANAEKSLLGGGFGTALNPLAGVGHLNRVDVILNGPELALAVIRKQALLPYLLPAGWDAARGRWKDKEPSAYEGIRPLAALVSTRVDTYRLTLEIKARAGDARTAHRILEGYLGALNERLKQSIVKDAAANREYLESQLTRTYDPWIKDKIQQLILNQIETGMLLNANAFEVLVGPVYPRRPEGPKRGRIVLLSAAAAFALSCGAVLLAAAARRGRTTARRA